MTDKIKKICKECSGTNVRIDAWAEWSALEQSWVLHDIYPDLTEPWCVDCDSECVIEEEKI